MKKIGFLSFGHWSPERGSQVRTAGDVLLQSIDLAVAAEIDRVEVRVNHPTRRGSTAGGALVGPGARTLPVSVVLAWGAGVLGPVEVGLDADRVGAFLASDEGRGEVTELLATAAANGITAVPTYVINGQWAVPGAQDPAVFERVINRLLDNEAADLSVPEAS